MKKKGEMREFKIITMGETGVGKTSILTRFTKQEFNEYSFVTIGVAFSTKEIKTKSGETIMLKLVDTAGQEKYRSLTRSYFKNVNAVLFVFSLYEKGTFTNMKEWIELFDENCSSNKDIPKYLIGNKSDLEHNVTEDEIATFLEENKGLKYKETSARNNEAITDLFEELAETLAQTEKKQDKQNIKSINTPKKVTKRKSCCVPEDIEVNAGDF
jgi:Ras-related protein Rab-11A